MKKIKSDEDLSINESLLGGASLSIHDLEIVESNEIKWIHEKNRTLNISNRSIAA